MVKLTLIMEVLALCLDSVYMLVDINTIAKKAINSLFNIIVYNTVVNIYRLYY